MSDPDLPLVMEPDELEKHLDHPRLFVIDLSKPETFSQAHIPGSVHLDYGDIVAGDMPAMGLLPPAEQLSQVFSELGLVPEHHVVALDDEGGGRACRLLWTLEVIGHQHYSLLNGGIIAWTNERHPVTTDLHHPEPSDYSVQPGTDGLADRVYILDHLESGDVALLDTRSPEEYSGQKQLAAKGGHIPGAVNYNWTKAMDPQHNYRLRPAVELKADMEQLGVTPDKEVVVYCQTHHRSAHTFIMLKSLGYTRLRGYPGSWSEWGNDPDTPIEV